MSKAGSKVNVNLSKEIGKEVKAQLDAVLKEIQGYETKISKAVNNAVSGASKVGRKAAQSNELKETIALLKEYYSILSKAESAIKKGDKAGGSSLRNEAEQLIA